MQINSVYYIVKNVMHVEEAGHKQIGNFYESCDM
jgi:hypothetical protein